MGTGGALAFGDRGRARGAYFGEALDNPIRA